MAYEKTRKLMASHGLEDADVREIIDTWADELQAQEPHAVVPISHARGLSEEFGTED